MSLPFSLLSLTFFLNVAQALILQHGYENGHPACENATFTLVDHNPNERPPFHVQVLYSNYRTLADLGTPASHRLEIYWQVKAPPGVSLWLFTSSVHSNHPWSHAWEFNVTEGGTSCMSEAELSAFSFPTTLPADTSAVLTSTTATNPPSSAIASSSPPTVDQIPSAVIIGGTIGGVLSFLLLILAAWLYFRRIQKKRHQAELPIQCPSLSSLVGLGKGLDNKYLTPVPSIPSSATQIATDPGELSFIEQQKFYPVSPAARSSMIMPLEDRPESCISTASTIVPSPSLRAYAY